jgi:hypothetical protein
MPFAPGLVGTFQDSDGGAGSHCPVPLYYRPLPMSRSIGEPLSDDAFEDLVGTLNVVDSERDSLIVSEVEFGEVTVQMFLADMLINAVDAALEDREVPLGSIGVSIASDVFFLSVDDGLMASELLADLPVNAAFVGAKVRSLVDPSFKNWAQIRGVHFRDVVRADAPLAFDQGDNRFLRGRRSVGAVAGLATDEGFIRFNEFAFAAERAAIVTNTDIGHGLADTVRQEPRGLQTDAENAVQLVGAHAFLAGTHQMHCLQPDMQLDVAGLEDGPDLDGERLAASVALIDPDAGAVTFQRSALVDNAAMRARAPVRPESPFHEPIGGFIAMEMCGGKDGRHGVSP